MRILFALAISLMIHTSTQGQIAVDALAGHKETHYINYIIKDLDSVAKWNFFSLNRFTVNYNDRALNTISIEGQLSYQLTPWLGISAGGGFYGDLFAPAIGLSLGYLNKKEDFYILMYPTLGYADKQIGPSLFGLIGYVPKFNKSWGLSAQMIFSAYPIESSQIIRIGPEYKNKIQFGLGIDMLQNFEKKNSNFNFGPYVRYTL